MFTVENIMGIILFTLVVAWVIREMLNKRPKCGKFTAPANKCNDDKCIHGDGTQCWFGTNYSNEEIIDNILGDNKNGKKDI